MRPSAEFRSAVLLCLLAAGCAATPTMQVDAERSPSANLALYRTYRWKSAPEEPPQGTRSARAMLDWRIRNAVDDQLAAKGFARRDSGAADFLVDYRIEVKEKSTESFDDYWRYRQGGGDADLFESYVFGYDEGSLILDIVDGPTKQLAWRGTATAVLTQGKSGERVGEAVHQMLERFPSR